MEQHHTDQRSGIYQHKEAEQHNEYEYKILAKCENEIKLRITEGLLIEKNNKMEVEAFITTKIAPLFAFPNSLPCIAGTKSLLFLLHFEIKTENRRSSFFFGLKTRIMKHSIFCLHKHKLIQF